MRPGSSVASSNAMKEMGSPRHIPFIFEQGDCDWWNSINAEGSHHPILRSYPPFMDYNAPHRLGSRFAATVVRACGQKRPARSRAEVVNFEIYEKLQFQLRNYI
jgi:hypothetical protein